MLLFAALRHAIISVAAACHYLRRGGMFSQQCSGMRSNGMLLLASVQRHAIISGAALCYYQRCSAMLLLAVQQILFAVDRSGMVL